MAAITTDTTAERLARLEEGQRHLATKEDVANLRADLLKWGIGLFLGGMAAAGAVAAAIARLL